MTDETDFDAVAGRGYARIGALEAAVNAHTPMLTAHSKRLEELVGRIQGIEARADNNYVELRGRVGALEKELAKLVGESDLEERVKKIENSDNAIIHLTAESMVEAGRRIEKLEEHVFPKPPVTTFDTIDRLINAIEQSFDCKDGAYGSYALAERTDGLRYRTLGLITENDDYPFERLRMELMKDFAAIAMVKTGDEKPTLYWRFAKEMRIEEDFSPSFERRGKIYKIRTRVAIPSWDRWGTLRSFAEEGHKYRSID